MILSRSWGVTVTHDRDMSVMWPLVGDANASTMPPMGRRAILERPESTVPNLMRIKLVFVGCCEREHHERIEMA